MYDLLWVPMLLSWTMGDRLGTMDNFPIFQPITALFEMKSKVYMITQMNASLYVMS